MSQRDLDQQQLYNKQSIQTKYLKAAGMEGFTPSNA